MSSMSPMRAEQGAGGDLNKVSEIGVEFEL